jgi:hypothetical protein
MTLIVAPDMGINNLLAANLIDDRETPFCRNVLFDQGRIITPDGFSKVFAGSSALSGNVLKIFPYKDHYGTKYVIAVTENKIYRRDSNTQTWIEIPLEDLTDGVLLASPVLPISCIPVRHTDGIVLDVGTDLSYYHLLICDGGRTPIQRWSGGNETSFYNLKGADGYHGVESPPITDHYARQINLYYDHVILLAPKTWDEVAEVFRENPQGILWGKAGKLEGGDAYKTGDAGVGYMDLADTGDVNVWCKILNRTLVVYQSHSIWSFYWVGGTDVFKANPEISDLGLLGPNLLVGADNVHYFLGNDWNIYAYYGGTTKEKIGNKIRNTLKADITEFNIHRCWMEADLIKSLLWIYYIPADRENIVRAYCVDARTGAWTVCDFEHKWPTTGGITTLALIGAQSYLIGKTIQQSIDLGETIKGQIDAVVTFNQLFYEEQTGETLMIGDSSGYIYQFSADAVDDDGVAIPSRYHTKVRDEGLPNKYKWWDTLIINASGTALRVSYRTSHFDTEDEEWVLLGDLTLTDEILPYVFNDINVTSKAIQWKFSDVDGADFAIESYDPGEPKVLSEV